MRIVDVLTPDMPAPDQGHVFAWRFNICDSSSERDLDHRAARSMGEDSQLATNRFGALPHACDAPVTSTSQLLRFWVDTTAVVTDA